MKRHDRIRQAFEEEFSFLNDHPSLHHRIMSQIKGERKVKKKMTLAMVFVFILVLITGTVAVATSCRGVAYFLGERTGESALDDEYLVSDMEQFHTSKLLHATVVDAYWDGLSLTIAYHVSPLDPAKSLRMRCNDTSHIHYTPAPEADILLHEPDFINVTSRTGGNVTRPLNVRCEWVYEEDGSLTTMVTFPHYDMPGTEWVSIPIFNTETATGNLSVSMLHCDPTCLTNPIPEHEHDWLPATCVSVKTCSICRRGEGGLGLHDFRPTEDEKVLLCANCTQEYPRPYNIPKTTTLLQGDYNNFVILVQMCLIDQGYYTAPITGLYDDLTTAAVKDFQEDHGLPVNGVCDPETIQFLLP